MKITDALLNADPRAAIDCRSCRFFNPCEDCRYHDECTNQGPDPSYSGCCDNINHRGCMDAGVLRTMVVPKENIQMINSLN